jgi:hypothetical protein
MRDEELRIAPEQLCETVPERRKQMRRTPRRRADWRVASQQLTASRNAREAWAIRRAGSSVTRRRKADLGTV